MDGQKDIQDKTIEEFLSFFNGDASQAIKSLEVYRRKAQLEVNEYSASTGTVLIDIQSVRKAYKSGQRYIEALRDVSLQIRQGEFIAITGSSGSGKSTLLQLIGGLDRLTEGSITIDGVNINKLRDSKLSTFRNKTIGFVFQFFYLQPFLKLTTNAELPAMFAHRNRKERKIVAEELLKAVGLSERAEHYPSELSGGQMQRAAIARALINNPKILLADEPTGNLDSVNSGEIIKLFRRIQKERGMTIIVVTHNPEIAASADREIRLRDGVLV